MSADDILGICNVCQREPSFFCREHFVARIRELETALTELLDQASPVEVMRACLVCGSYHAREAMADQDTSCIGSRARHVAERTSPSVCDSPDPKVRP